MNRLVRPIAFLLASLLTLVVTLLRTPDAQAFCWGPARFPGASTTYLIDGSYSWSSSSVQDAVADWNYSAYFGFGYTGGGNNHIQGADLGCDFGLAGMSPSDNGGTRNGFIIQVNNGCGTPWYDGTGQPPSNYYAVRSVMRHELGHAIGLCHNNDQFELMNTFLQPGVSYGIGVEDVTGVNWAYQPGYAGPGPSPGCP